PIGGTPASARSTAVPPGPSPDAHRSSARQPAGRAAAGATTTTPARGAAIRAGAGARMSSGPSILAQLARQRARPRDERRDLLAVRGRERHLIEAQQQLAQ